MSQVVSAFFSAELANNECSTGYIFSISQKSGKLILKESPKPNDVLRIFGVFQINSTVITKSYQFIINKDGKSFKSLKNEKQESQNTYANDQFATTGYKGKLLFEENFKDLDRWNQASFSGMRTLKVEQAVYLKNNTYIKYGNLHIKASLRTDRRRLTLPDCTHREKRKHCTPLTYRNPLGAAVNSGIVFNNNIYFRHGHFEVRAKFAKGDFLRSCMYLKPFLYIKKNVI